MSHTNKNLMDLQQQKIALEKEIKAIHDEKVKQEKEFEESHNYSVKDAQNVDSILVMIGNTGNGKSTLGNRIFGDTSRKGNEGPFRVSARKDEAGTSRITSIITKPSTIERFSIIINICYVITMIFCSMSPFIFISQFFFDLYIPYIISNIFYVLSLCLFLHFLNGGNWKKKEGKSRRLLIVDTPGWGDVKAKNRVYVCIHLCIMMNQAKICFVE